MRASRLVSLLLLLQARGRMTAPALASELEVSVRTIYRDVEALGAAGVPIYAQPGPTGGIQLVDGYRTRLTGLTEREADSLFLAGAPGAVAQLGLGTVLAAAELKVLAALPRELRGRAARVRERFHLDAPGWFSRPEEVPMLATLAGAVWDDRRIELRYARRDHPPRGARGASADSASADSASADSASADSASARGAGAGGAGASGASADSAGASGAIAGGTNAGGAGADGAGVGGVGAARDPMADPVAEVRRSLDPLGLVLKGGVWYLVARHRSSIRTYRVSRCRAVEILTSRFERPEGFVLADYWAASQQEFEQAILHYTIDARLSPAAIRRLPTVAAGGPARLALASASAPDADGWVRVALPAEGFGHATVEVMSLAPDIQVLGPPDLLGWVAATSAKMAARHPEPVAGKPTCALPCPSS